MNKRTFAENMTILSEAFDKEITPALTKIYWDRLGDASDEQFMKAVVAHIETERFFPRVADLVDKIKGSSLDNKHEAWASVVRALRDSSNMNLPESVMDAVNAIGGARSLGQMTERDLEFKKKDFFEVYEPETNVTGIEQRSVHPRLDSRAAD